MEEVKILLEARRKQLHKLKTEKEKALEGVPEGTLRISCHGNKLQYYYKEKKQSGGGTYMGKKNMDLVYKLAQKEYDRKVLKVVENELHVVEKCLSGYPQTGPEEVYSNLHVARRKLVTPIWEPDDEYVRKWESVTYQGKDFCEDAPEFYTIKNERVRSKSEWIIADLLAREGIPYRYEYPCYLKGLGQVYPDFMVLNVKMRKELYWEHLGMMDNLDYVEKALHKIAVYEQNGICLGKNLILTYETGKNPLSQKMVMNRIENYLK